MALIARVQEERLVQERKELSRGKQCTWNLVNNHSVPDSSNISSVLCTAIGGGGFVCIKDSGAVFQDGIPYEVFDVLRKQQFSNCDYIAIGPDDQYFIQKFNGKQISSNLNYNLVEALNNKGKVAKLALGPRSIFFVEFTDGSTQFQGLDEKANNILTNYIVKVIWIGGANSYYIKYKIGAEERSTYKNLPYALQKLVSNNSKDIRQLLYDGNYGTYFARYN